MYSTCMFCNRSLGENQVVEHFPVGRRLAFDAERGRLWVVCKKCERWNLTPIEERWEAIETCERIFSSTRVRVSTENVGLAKHPEGLILVRIGRPMRPEFAAWRYGDQFGRRRKRALLYGAGAMAVFGGVMVGGMAVGVGGAFIAQIGSFSNVWTERTLVKLRTADGKKLKLKNQDLLQTRLEPTDDDVGFRLEVGKGKKRSRWFEGEEARRVAAIVLPKINRMGGKEQLVQGAVAEIAHHGHPEAFLGELVDGDRFRSKKGVPGYVSTLR